MNLIVSPIVGGVNEQSSIVNSVYVDDWTADKAIISSNDVTESIYFIVNPRF